MPGEKLGHLVAEILMENFRRAIGLRSKETKEVWEGEVVELKPEE